MTTRQRPSPTGHAALLFALATAFFSAACSSSALSSSPMHLPTVVSSQHAATSRANDPAAASAASAAAADSGAAAETDTDASAEAPTRFAHVELVRFHTRLSRELPRLQNALQSVVADDGQSALRPGSLWFGEARHQVPAALWDSNPAVSIWQALVAWRGDEHLELMLEGPSKFAHLGSTQLILNVQPAEQAQHWKLSLRVRGPGADPEQALADDDSAPLEEHTFTKPRAEELLLKALPSSDEQALAILLPSPWDDGWLGLRLRPAQPTENIESAALAARDARLSVSKFQRPSPQGAGLTSVVNAGLARRETRRATLQHVANSVRLALLSELCLVAPDALLDAMSQATQARLGAGAPLTLPTLFGGMLDGLAETPLPDDDATLVSAVLREHLGALDRRRDLLADALPSFVNEAAVASFLRRENELLLDDSRAGTRLRAYEWLKRRQLAPEGYDPLGTSAERRAALQRAAEELS